MLHVCIDARLRDGESGGVQQIVIGLVDAITKRGPSDDMRFSFLVYRDGHDWLLPYVPDAAPFADD